MKFIFYEKPKKKILRPFGLNDDGIENEKNWMSWVITNWVPDCCCGLNLWQCVLYRQNGREREMKNNRKKREKLTRFHTLLLPISNLSSRVNVQSILARNGDSFDNLFIKYYFHCKNYLHRSRNSKMPSSI